MRAALPFLPYREPALIHGMEGVVTVLRNQNIPCVMLITDAGVHGLGLTAHLEALLDAAGIRCVVYDRTVANPTVANVEQARLLLESTDASVTEIGYQTGFNSSNSFIRTFKSCTCCTVCRC